MTKNDEFFWLTIENVPLAKEAQERRHATKMRQVGMEHFLLCRAETPMPREHAVFDGRACRKFFAKLYYKRNAKDIKDICIIFNGLDETPHKFPDESELFSFYDQLGDKLAENNVLAILLPAPYHLNRCLLYRSEAIAESRRQKYGVSFYDYTIPSLSLTKNPGLLYVNHYQSFREVVSLCRSLKHSSDSRNKARYFPNVCNSRTLISNEDAQKIRDKLNGEAKISLIGYSMGGLRAMTAFCYAWGQAQEAGHEPIFSSCVSINSGGTFSSMNPPTWVPARQWRKMVRELNYLEIDDAFKEQFKEDGGEFQKYRKAIRDITLGNGLKFQELHELNDDFTRRLLFILGGNDNIMDIRSLQRITPTGGLNIFQVAGVGHMLRNGEWGSQLGTMLNYISDFVTTKSEDLKTVSSQDLANYLSLFDRDYKLIPFVEGSPVDNIGTEQEFCALVDIIHNKDRRLLANIIFGPISDPKRTPSEPDYKWVNRFKRKSRLNEVCALAKDFLIYVHHTLRKRIDNRHCHPAVYKIQRRELLLGWMFSRKKELVNFWSFICRSQAEGKAANYFGEILIEKKIAPPEMIQGSLDTQRRVLEGIQQQMERTFRRYCRDEKKVEL